MEFVKNQIVGSKLRRNAKKKRVDFAERQPFDNQKKALANAFKYFPDLSGTDNQNLIETKLKTGNLEEIYAVKPGFIYLNPVILAGTMAYLSRNQSLLEFKLDLRTDFTLLKLKDIISIILKVNKTTDIDPNLDSQIAATIVRYTKWIFKIN